jgi:uncharacterized DUF497 family protein
MNSRNEGRSPEAETLVLMGHAQPHRVDERSGGGVKRHWDGILHWFGSRSSTECLIVSTASSSRERRRREAIGQCAPSIGVLLDSQKILRQAVRVISLQATTHNERHKYHMAIQPFTIGLPF